MHQNARFPTNVDQTIFGDLIPNEMTAEEIEHRQSGGYKLIATTRADDMGTPALQKRLEQQHSYVLHLQRSAYSGQELVGTNLFFIKKHKKSNHPMA